jgi:hypothetical protein
VNWTLRAPSALNKFCRACELPSHQPRHLGVAEAPSGELEEAKPAPLSFLDLGDTKRKIHGIKIEALWISRGASFFIGCLDL